MWELPNEEYESTKPSVGWASVVAKSSDSSFINIGVKAIAKVTTFELLHHAATRGMFSDYKIDDAVIKLMNPLIRGPLGRQRRLMAERR